MRRWFFYLTIVSSLLLMACKKDVPEPEVSAVINPVIMNDVGRSNDKRKNESALIVHHHLDGNNLFVECIVKGVTFRDEQSTDVNKGKIVVYLNGNKQTEVRSAAFILKGLPSGHHEIKLDIVSPDNERYNLEKEFSVTIP